MKGQRSLIMLIVLGAVGLSIRTANAGGFGLDEQGAAAMGMANAFAAQADDPTALFYNPAGIGQLEGTQISVGTTLIYPAYTFHSDTSGESTDTERELFFPPTFYASHAIRTGFHIGLGVFSPFGLSTEWPLDWEGRYVTTFSEINTVFVNPNLTWSPTDRVHVAAGISLVPSTVTLKNNLELTPFPDGEATIEADGTGWGYNLAALVKFQEAYSLGITFRSPVRINYDGEAAFTFPDPASNFKADVESELTLPPIAVVGAAGRAFEGYTFEADIQWTGWSRLNEIVIDFDDPSLPDAESPKDWEDTYTFRLGVKRAIGQWTLRGGYSYDLNPVPSDTIDPSLPDADKHSVAAGLGYDFGKIHLDLAYMLVVPKDREVDNVLETGATPLDHNGEYSATVHEFGVSVGYVF